MTTDKENALVEVMDRLNDLGASFEAAMTHLMTMPQESDLAGVYCDCLDLLGPRQRERDETLAQYRREESTNPGGASRPAIPTQGEQS